MSTMLGPKIEPIRAEAIPPAGSHPVGMLADGRIIYEREIEEFVGHEPLVIDGKQQYHRHPVTGEPIKEKTRAVFRRRTQRFVLEVGNNGNNFINEHFEPDPAEKERQAKQRARREFGERLAAAAVERGLTPEEVLDRLFSERAAIAAATVAEDALEDGTDVPEDVPFDPDVPPDIAADIAAERARARATARSRARGTAAKE